MNFIQQSKLVNNQPLVLLRKCKYDNISTITDYKYGDLQTGRFLNSRNHYVSIDAVGYIDFILKDNNISDINSTRAQKVIKEVFNELQIMYLEILKENPTISYKKLIIKMEKQINQQEYELTKENNKLLKKALIYDIMYTDGRNSIK